MNNEKLVYKRLCVQIGNHSMMKHSIRIIRDKLYDQFGDYATIDVNAGTTRLEFYITLKFQKDDFLRCKLLHDVSFEGEFMNDILHHDTNPWIISNMYAYWMK